MTNKSRLLEIVNPLHRRTERDVLARMMDRKVECMGVAKRYDQDYWDGDRCYGYGGYGYDGRWKVVAEALIRHYQLGGQSRILDIGCGKGYLLYELQLLLPHAEVTGIDDSQYALSHAKQEIAHRLLLHDAQNPLPFDESSFDLVLSLTTLHNLPIYGLKTALKEMTRVGNNQYLVVESYRNDQELFNLQCWALTCQSFFTPDEWTWLFDEFGYTGDYEFIYF